MSEGVVFLSGVNRRTLCLGVSMLSALVISCDRDPHGGAKPPPAAPTPASAVIEQAHQALALAAGRPLPLSRASTRREREEYLQSAAAALKALLSLPSAERDKPPPNSVTRETLEQVSGLLAVELADAVDRDHPDRVAGAIRAAYAYADYLSTSGVTAWVLTSAVPERLAAGVRSVAHQVDADVVETVNRTLDAISAAPPEPKTAIEATHGRILDWRAKLNGDTSVEALLKAYGTSADGRPSLSEDLEEQVRAFATRHGDANVISGKTLQREADIAVAVLTDFLDRAARGEPCHIERPSPKEHPVAFLFVVFFWPDVEMAPHLTALRQEGIQILALTVRIIAAGFPPDLSSFAELAVSPVSNLPFGYKVEGDTFVLERPRRTNPPPVAENGKG
jgi:hypothetical protein